MSKKEEEVGKTTEIKRSKAFVPRKRDWEGIALKPMIADFEVSLDPRIQNKPEIVKAFEQLGDGALIAQGQAAAGLTWQVTGTFPPDIDAGIDGEFFAE